MPRRPRIAVMGAGAMGAIVGSAMAQSADVVLVDVSEQLVSRIREHGLQIERAGETATHRLDATTTTESMGPVDYVVFFVKCYHTASATELAAPLVGDDTFLVSLQNGWGNGDVLARRFGAERIIVGVTYNSGTVRELGVVAHTGAGPTHVGAFDGADPEAVRAFAALLMSAQLETTVSDSIATEIWKKLILNAATLPTAALTGLNAGSLESCTETNALIDVVAREAIAVAQAKGYAINGEERLAAIHAVLERAGEGKPSMLQDLEAGRRTEVDVVNGAVVNAAHNAGVPAPVNDTLVALVKGWERAHGLL